MRDNLRLTREVRFTWAQVGDKLEEQFTLTNNGSVPATWVEVVDHSTLPDYSAARAIEWGVRKRSNGARRDCARNAVCMCSAGRRCAAAIRLEFLRLRYTSRKAFR
ncbi:MAG: DUF11 domain-containing protein [Anaerolineales bacterium]|uniref:hypothetical protein n=1 Tax=Candidatus Villigracilis proximus TaxID=3140683 RepID=UPI003135918E|nr:DUF11 domain-containing protein [Anaerolineales bacterium]